MDFLSLPPEIIEKITAQVRRGRQNVSCFPHLGV